MPFSHGRVTPVCMPPAEHHTHPELTRTGCFPLFDSLPAPNPRFCPAPSLRSCAGCWLLMALSSFCPASSLQASDLGWRAVRHCCLACWPWWRREQQLACARSVWEGLCGISAAWYSSTASCLNHCRPSRTGLHKHSGRLPWRRNRANACFGTARVLRVDNIAARIAAAINRVRTCKLVVLQRDVLFLCASCHLPPPHPPVCTYVAADGSGRCPQRSAQPISQPAGQAPWCTVH